MNVKVSERLRCADVGGLLGAIHLVPWKLTWVSGFLALHTVNVSQLSTYYSYYRFILWRFELLRLGTGRLNHWAMWAAAYCPSLCRRRGASVGATWLNLSRLFPRASQRGTFADLLACIRVRYIVDCSELKPVQNANFKLIRLQIYRWWFCENWMQVRENVSLLVIPTRAHSWQRRLRRRKRCARVRTSSVEVSGWLFILGRIFSN
jgi:hypothetical protein